MTNIFFSMRISLDLVIFAAPTLGSYLRSNKLLFECWRTHTCKGTCAYSMILQKCQNLLFFLLVASHAPTVPVLGVLAHKNRVTVHSDQFLRIYQISAPSDGVCYLRRSDAHSLADCQLTHLAT